MYALTTQGGWRVAAVPQRHPIRLPDPRGPLVAALVVALVASVSALVPFGAPTAQQEAAEAAASAGATAAASQFVQAGDVPDGLTAAEWSAIRQQIAAAEAVEAVPAAVSRGSAAAATAATPAAALVAADVVSSGTAARFDPDGAVVAASGDASSVTFRTARVGDVALAGVPVESALGRFEYRHSTAITEWYRDTVAGLQHGFTLAAPVTTNHHTVVEVEVASGTPALVDSQTVRIETPTGAEYTYRDLIAWDANGVSLDAVMSVVDGAITLTVETIDAVYPVTIDPIITGDQSILAPTNASGEQSGAAVAIDEDTVVISSPFDDDTGLDRGKVEVYDYDPGSGSATYRQAWYNGIGIDSDYGFSVDVEGDVFVVGAPGDSANGADAGAVYVYTRPGPGTDWTVPTTLFACGSVSCANTSTGSGTAGDRFGEAVALSDAGTTLVVGAPQTGTGATGEVHVIDLATNTTTAVLVGGSSAADDAFGAALDVSHDASLIGVGAPKADTGISDSGRAYVFEVAGSTYVERADITPAGPINHGASPDANFGAAIAIESRGLNPYVAVSEPFVTRLPGDVGGGVGGVFVYDLTTPSAPADMGSFGVAPPVDNAFGFSLSAENDFVLIGAPGDGANGTLTILERSGASFSSTQAIPVLAGGETGAAVGWSVAIGSAGSAAYGLPLFDDITVGTATGSAEVDRGQTRVWDDISLATPVETPISSFTGARHDEFGYAVDIEGNRMAVSAPYDDEPAPRSGVVHIFERPGQAGVWSLVATIRSTVPEEIGHFGDSLDLFGDRIAIGESDRLGDQAEAGRVHVFERQGGGAWTPLGAPILQFPGATAYDAFGASVAFVDNDRLIIGAPARGGADRGAVYATAWSGAVWALPVQLTTGAPFPGDRIGHSVAAATGPSGTIAVAGAPGDAGGDGAIYIWEDIGSGFGAGTAVRKLTAADGWSTGDGVGGSVATDGYRIVAAGMGDQTALQPFTAHAFEVSVPTTPNTWGHVWDFRGTLPVTVNGPVNDYVDVFGGTIALGRPGQGGQVGLFRSNGTTWPESPDDQLIPSGTVNGDRVGQSVSIDADSVLTGSPGDDALSQDAGQATLLRVPMVADYVGSPSGDLLTPANWATGTVPAAGDSAIIGSGALTVGGTLEVGRLALASGASLEILPGETLSLTGPADGSPSLVDGTLENSSSTTLDINADLVIGAGATVLTNAGATTNLDAIDGPIAITGDGTFQVEGTLNKGGPFNAAFASTVEYVTIGGSDTNVDEGTLVLDTPVVENGTLRVAAGGANVDYGDEFSANAGTVIELDIDGQFDHGALYFGATVAPEFGGATLRTTGSYSPASGDSFIVIGCYDCGSPDLLYDVGFLEPSVAGTPADDSITLTMPDLIIVDTLDGLGLADGFCSLREAITAANTDTPNDSCAAGSGADTIVFDVSGTIPLNTRLPAITSNITIDGVGQSIVIDGQTTNGSDGTPLARVNAGATADLDNLTFSRGRSQSCDGGDTCGAVLNYGTLNVSDSTFASNQGGGFTNGIAITNRGGGHVTIDRSTFNDNTGVSSGAVWNASNGAHVVQTTMSITNSTFTGNSAGGGAAIYNTFNATLDISNSTFVDNTSASNGTVNNAGGASAAVTITNSTFVDNNGSMTLKNSSPSTMVVRNTIITETTSGAACSAAFPPSVDSSNIDTDGTCGSASTSDSLRLDVLADNGGPTETIGLLPGSAAFGAGRTTDCANPPVNGLDQRGESRSGTWCDVGAFEVRTLTVDSVADAADAAPGDGVCETAPGNDVCTLRAAIEESNATAQAEAIYFDIAGGGVQTISPASALPTIDGPVTIDAATQPGADCSAWPPTLQVELDGSSSGTLNLNGNVAMRGLVVNGWVFPTDGMNIGGAGAQLECNFIGTNASGTATSGEGGNTIWLAGSGHVIGGSSPTQANLIAGASNGQIFLDSTGAVIQGNYFNSDPSGVVLPIISGVSRQETIWITGSNNLIGGTGAGEGNRFAGINGQAIQMVAGTGNSIRGNSITDHVALGIDNDSFPFSPGVTPNDALDADAGPNNTQNFPVLTTALDLTGSTQVTGTLDSTASRTYEIDVFENAVCDASGHGEGDIYLGTFSATTNGSGTATFDETLPVGATPGSAITTTATDMTTGDTSEFSACVILTDPSTAGPTPTVGWANRFGGGTGIDVSNESAIDTSGNVLVTGFFTGTVDFDPGPGILNLASASGSEDAYVYKLDSDGELVWARRFGDTGNDNATAVATDDLDNVYVAGAFYGTVDFDPGAGVANETSAANRDMFLVKLDADGDFVWVRTITTTGDSVNARLAVSASGEASLGADYSGTVDLDPGVGVFDPGPTASNAFVVRLDAAGDFVWGFATDATLGATLTDVALDDSGALYATGTFNGSMDIGADTLNTAGSNDGWVAKYSDTGVFAWSGQIGGAGGGDYLSTVAVNGAGTDIYVGGGVVGSVDIDPGAGVTTATGLGFISRLDATGDLVSATEFTGSGVGAVRLDSDGNVAFATNYVGTVDLDPGAGVLEVTSVGGSNDVAVGKLDPAGNLLWGGSIGGVGLDQQLHRSLAVDEVGNVYLTGWFFGTSDFDPDPVGTLNLASASGTGDGFVVKLGSALLLTTGTVNSTGDAPDADPGDGFCQTATPGECTLRAALQESNALAGVQTITFDIPGAGPHTIQPLSDMTHLQDEVIIDGYSQPGASRNTLSVGNDAVLQIVLNGQGAPGVSDRWGLYVNTGGSNSHITGLVINGYSDFTWGEGIKVQYAEGVTIEGNFIGTDPTGTAAVPNKHGIRFDEQGIYPGVHQVGGPTPGERNLISGNTGYGVWNGYWDTGKSNVIQGNYIGTNAAGTAAIPNLVGVFAEQRTTPVVGGTAPGEGNLISGNSVGIGMQSSPTTILGNLIGTDATGLLAVPNGYGIQNGTEGGFNGLHLIGDGTAGGRNVIAGNTTGGINAFGRVSVRGNYIGVGVDGTTPLGNGGPGIRLQTSDNSIGGSNPGDANVITENTTGVEIAAGLNNSVVGNSFSYNTIAGLTIAGAGVNDPGDGDAGVNNLQNYPELSLATLAGDDLTVDFAVDSLLTASTYPIQIDVYRVDDEPSAQGALFLGRTSIAGPGSDQAVLSGMTGLGLEAGDPIVATATDANGNTSLFSPPVSAEGADPANKIFPDTAVDRWFGASVSIDGDWAAVGQPDTGAGFGAVSILERNPGDGSWSIVQTLVDPAFRRFGASVALDGNLLAVTANIPAGGGVVKTFTRPDTSTPFSPDVFINVGEDAVVDVSGDDVIIGSEGTVEIRNRAGGPWVTQLLTSGGTSFASTVAIDGDVAVVGDTSNTIAGSVIVYQRALSIWTPVETLTNPDAVTAGDAWFGSALAIDGTTLAVGHSLNDQPDHDEGVVWVYEGTPGTFAGSEVMLTGTPTGTGDVFGQAVDVDGDWIVVGTPAHNEPGVDARAGAAFVFERDGGAWTQTDFILADDRYTGDQFGEAVAIGDTGVGANLLVGAPGDNNIDGMDVGAVYAFAATPTNPVVPGRIYAPDAAQDDYFGQSVDIHDDWMVVGARNGDGAVVDSGTAYVFRRDSVTDDWNFVTELEASDGAADQWFGQSVAISGTRLDDDGDLGNYVIAVGAPSLLTAGASAGAVYLYRYDFLADNWIETEKIPAPANTSEFGWSVDLEQTSDAYRNGSYRLVAGAPGITGVTLSGNVSVYRYTVTENPSFSDTLTFLDTADAPDSTSFNWFGFSVAIDGETIVVGESKAAVAGATDAGQAHVYSYDPLTTSVDFEATLVQPGVDRDDGDGHGHSVDVDGDLIVVSAFFDATAAGSAGAAYVYRRSVSAWGPGIELQSAATGAGDNFGLKARVEDGVIAVSSFAGGLGDSGTVQVFEFDSSVGWIAGSTLEWQQGGASTGMGAGLALSEDGILAAGAAEDDNAGGVDAGAVQVFDVDILPPGNKLTSAQDIDLAEFGGDVDVDGEWAIVGAEGAGAGATGSAYMFRKVLGQWQLFQELGDPNPGDSNDDYGVAVAVGGNFAAVADQGDDHVFWFDGVSWTLAGDFYTPGFDSFEIDLDIDGANDRLIVGYASSGAVTGRIEIYNLFSSFQPSSEDVIQAAASTGTFYGHSVAIQGDVAFVSAETANGNDGSVIVFERFDDGEIVDWSENQSITPPSGTAQFFGSDLDVGGDHLIVGQQAGNRAWIFELDAGSWTNPVELGGTGSQGGRSVSISGDIAVAGSPRSTVDGLWAGSADVFARAGDDWILTDTVSAADREFGDAFATSVAIDGSDLFVGARYDTNIDGVQSGGVYVYEVVAPENATITFGIDVATAAAVKVADTGVPVVDFAAPVLEKSADNTTSLAAAPLAGIELEDTPLAGIAVGNTPLAGIVLESAPLAGIPLIDVDVDGGWEVLLDGTGLEDFPLVDLTFGDALSYQDPAGEFVVAERVAALPLAGIDVDGTPLAGIPLAGIALGTIPLAGIPLAGIGQNWCDIVAEIGVTCATPGDESSLTDITLMEATLRGVPLAGIPLAGIPLAGIDFAATPLAGIPLAGIEFRSTPLAGIPLAGIAASTPLAGIPLAGIDLSETPLAGIPLAGIPLAGIPLAGIPLAGIDVDNTPLAGIPLADIPLAGIATSTPLAGIPLAGIELEGAPLAGIPLAGIQLMDLPLAGIPLAGIGTEDTAVNDATWCTLLSELGAPDVCDDNGTLGATTLFEIAAQGVPLAGIPLAGIPLAGIDLSGAPLAGIALAGIPLAGIPLAGIPLAGIDLTGTPLAGIPLAGIPLAGIDIAGSPLAGIPLAGIDLAGSPLAGIPLAGIPLAGIPLAGIPLAGIDLTGTPLAGIGDLMSVPLAGIDVTGSPLAGIPLAGIDLTGIPLAGIGVDCEAGVVNCELDSLGDAVRAGAVDLDTTLDQLRPALAGLSLADIAGHVDGLTSDDLQNLLAEAELTLGSLTDLDDMTLGDLPAYDRAFDLVTLGDIEQQLINVTFADLLGALLDPGTGKPIDDAVLEVALRAAIDALGLVVDDLAVRGEVTLADLLDGDAGTFTLADLGHILGLISVQSLIDAYAQDPTTGSASEPVLQGVLGDLDLDELGDMTLADLIGVDQFGDLETDAFLAFLDSLGLLAGFSIGDLLLGLVDAKQLPFGGFDFTDVEVGNLPAGVVSDVTFSASFRIGDTENEQVVEVSTILPTTASYVAGTSLVSVTVGAASPVVTAVEPVIDGNTLIWQIEGVTQDADYDIEFDVRPEIDLGSSVVNGSARIVGAAATAEAFGAVQVLEGLEPNDFDPEVTVVADDTIYLTYISDSTDIDVFQVALQDNDVLAVELSNLGADFDVALYVDPDDPAVGSSLSLTSDNAPVFPITDPDQTGADAEPLDDFTRLDLIDPNLDLIEVSNAAGLENELIVTDRLPAGTYYVQVFGANGVSSPKPAALQIQIDEAENRPVCQAIGPMDALAQIGTTNTLPADPVELAGINALFLVNEQRLEHFNDLAGRQAVMDELLGVDGLVAYLQDNPQLGINPAVVAVDGNPVVWSAYDAWDNPANLDDACDPEVANGVVEAINTEIIDPIRDQLDYIVMIGGDEQIPMARLEDNTTVANEYDYRHEFDGDLDPTFQDQDPNGANAFTSAPWERRFFSDEPYGESAAQSLGNRYLYVSDIALGRLVESPAEIVRSLGDFVDYEGSLDTSTAAVLGYDFLVDGSEAIAADLAASPVLTLDDSLADGIGEGLTDLDSCGDVLPSADTKWSRKDAECALLAAGQNALISLNAHFDHYRALPAEGDQDPAFVDNLIASTVAGLLGATGLSKSVVFSMGCHSGLAVPDSLIAGTNTDWAQQIAQTGGIYIANTGFGYGDTESVAYTEQLMALFAEQATTPIEVNGLQTTVGQALMFAKNQYISELGVLSVYDEKAVMESTFYGLPFYRTALPNAVAPPVPVNVPAPDTTGDPAVTYVSQPTNDEQVTDSGVYYANQDENGDEQVIVGPGRPIQPADVIDISVVDPGDTTRLEQRAHGAIVLDMTSNYFQQPDPVIATPVFNESESRPEPEIGDQTFPTKPVRLATYRSPSGVRQNLVLATGQYRASTETQRLDDEIDVLVYYAAVGETDFTTPTIRTVNSTVEDGLVTITLDVTDGSGVDRVYVLLAENPGAGQVDWRGLDLANTGGDRWAGSLQLTPGTNNIEFLVQAKDAAGNVGYSTNKATNFSDDTTPPPPPPPTPDLDVIVDTGNLDVGTGWYTGPVTITVDSGDIDATYAVDGAPPAPLPVIGSFQITGDGIHTWVVEIANGQQQSGTVRIDTTAEPVITLGTPTSGGVYQDGTATIDLLCQDPSLSTCVVTIDGTIVEVGDPLPEPGSYTLTVTAVDVFGNPSTATVPFTVTSSDVTPPLVTGVADPVANTVGWHNAPVTVVWTAVDPSPSSGAPNQPADTYVDTEGGVVEVVSEQSCDGAGNCDTGSLTLALDFTAPEIDADLGSVPNAAGWFNESPTVSFDCTDALSGVALCPDPVVVPEGADQWVSGTAVDVAGNEATAMIGDIDVDLTPPSITATINPGWTEPEVVPAAVVFDCDDALSDIAACPPAVALTGEPGQVVVGEATDVAGNVASTTITITATDGPLVMVSRTPEPNPAGWNNEPVQISFDCSDPTWGVYTCPDTIVYGNEGTQPATVATAVNWAGASTDVTVPGVSIDLTPPQVQLLGVADGDVFDLGNEPTPTCSTSDALSGVEQPAALDIVGGNLDGTGVFTVSCSGATDVAGNTAATVEATYQVHYLLADGVFTGGPVQAAPEVNSGKSGRTYPVRWTLSDAAGGTVADLSLVTSITYTSADCDTFTESGADDIEGESTGGGLSLTSGGEFKFNWVSPKGRACWVLSINLVDGNSLTANFDLR